MSSIKLICSVVFKISLFKISQTCADPVSIWTRKATASDKANLDAHPICSPRIDPCLNLLLGSAAISGSEAVGKVDLSTQFATGRTAPTVLPVWQY